VTCSTDSHLFTGDTAIRLVVKTHVLPDIYIVFSTNKKKHDYAKYPVHKSGFYWSTTETKDRH